MTAAFLTPSFCTAYVDAAALSPTDTEMKAVAFGALLSTGVNGIGPSTARFERFHTANAPGAPTSAPPRMKTGFLPAIWAAQRADVGGVASLAQVTSFTG